MCSVKLLALAGAAMIVGISSASAADLPPVYQKAPPVVEEVGGGWYLRGDIGFSNQALKSLSNNLDATTTSFQYLDKGFDAAPLFKFGVGYQFTPWLRADVTGEYRGSASFHAFEMYTAPGIIAGTDNYTASKSEWVGLVNAYADLGTWWCVTPFVGAGVGVSDVVISHFRDMGTVNRGAGTTPTAGAVGDSQSTKNFAWALYAGLAYKVTPGLTMELAYRYIDLGNGGSGAVTDPTTGQSATFNFNHITSQDLMLGMRWNFAPTMSEPFVPLMRKG